MDPRVKFRRRLREVLPAAFLAVLAIAVYWPALKNGFVFDDELYLLHNRPLQGGFTWETVRWAFTTTYAANWHPLTWLSHLLDLKLFGLVPRGHHLVNLILHAANAALLFLFLKRLTGALWRSIAAAALFAVHPLHVESVAWIAERKDLLSTFLGLLSAAAYVAYARRPGFRRLARIFHTSSTAVAQSHLSADFSSVGLLDVVSTTPAQPSVGKVTIQATLSRLATNTCEICGLALATALFALGLAAKPMLVTLPCLFLLIDYWPLGRMPPAPGAAPPGGPGRWRRSAGLLLEKAPLLALSAASGIITIHAQGELVSSWRFYPAHLRLLNAVTAYGRYLLKAVRPDGLAVFYPHPGQALPLRQAAAAGIVLTALTALALLARRRPYIAVGWLWYLGTMAPVIGLVQVGMQSMADRYTYIPLTGLFVGLVWGMDAAVGREKRRRVFLAAAFSAVVLTLGAATRHYLGFWKDDRTLFGRAARAVPGNWFAHQNLAGAAAERGDFEEAARQYRRVIELEPAFPKAYDGLGHALDKLGRTEEAVGLLTTAVRLDPRSAEARNNLGIAMERLGRNPEAAANYREAARLDPSLAEAFYNLGNSLSAMGRIEESIRAYRQAVEINPRYAVAYNNLGLVYGQLKRYREAAAAYREAVRVKPDYDNANFGLGLAYLGLGEHAAAQAQYHILLKSNPGLAAELSIYLPGSPVLNR